MNTLKDCNKVPMLAMHTYQFKTVFFLEINKMKSI